MVPVSRDAKSYWDPSENPLHQLILLMDVLAISLSRFRHLSFRLKSIEDPDSQCIMDQHTHVRHVVFPRDDIAPHHTADRLAAKAIASFPNEQETIGEAANWLAETGRLTPHFANTCPCNTGLTDDQLIKRLNAEAKYDVVFRKEGELLTRYISIRSNLINALARNGQSIPDCIYRRLALAGNPWTTLNEPISQEALIEMLHEMEPYRLGRHESVDVDRPLNDPNQIIDDIKEVQHEIDSLRNGLLPGIFVIKVLEKSGSKYMDQMLREPFENRSYSKLQSIYLIIYSLRVSFGFSDQLPDLIPQNVNLKKAIQYLDELDSFCEEMLLNVQDASAHKTTGKNIIIDPHVLTALANGQESKFQTPQDETTPSQVESGPFGVDGFRFGGVEVRFARANKQYNLVKSLWDNAKQCPMTPARSKM